MRAAETVAQSSRGYDDGKKINGLKRHIAVDSCGLLLVLVTGAAVQDRDGRSSQSARRDRIHEEVASRLRLRHDAARMPKAVAGSAHHRDEQTGGGRRVVREIWIADAAGIDFPGARQVFRIRRSVYDLAGHRITKDIVHAITSLDPNRATGAHLLTLVRDHWLLRNLGAPQPSPYR